METNFGINVSFQHCIHYPIEEYVQCIIQSKATWVRFEIDWYDRVFNEDHKTKIVTFIKALHEQNINILGVLMGLVPGTMTHIFFKKKLFKPPITHLDEFLNFVCDFVTILQPYITHWEIWNEPNAIRFWRKEISPEEYGILLKSVKQKIKEIDPNAKFVFGGIVGNDISRFIGIKNGFFKQSRELGITNEVDYYAIHPYTIDSYIPWYRTKHSLITEIKKRITLFKEEFPEKPIMITEYGISSLTSSFSDKTIGEIYSELITFCSSQQILLFLWVLVDFSSKEYSYFNPETKFGMYTKKLKPKKSLLYLQKKI